MGTNNTQKKSPRKNWHRAYIGARLKMNGTNTAKLSRDHGYPGDALKNAYVQPWPKAEKIIASAIGVTPEEIWPERYEGVK
ncbi:MAG: DNA-binding protein [Gammaproteobacteria bacterium]|nr:MAG: DNA-binding protein [Gammaproteobacteria bacterium]